VNVMDANELYDPEFRKLIKSKKQTVIIPVGSLEQHGAHLPITTDSDIVTEIASRLAKKCGFIVFPTINYGISFEHSPLFNTSVTATALGIIISNIVTSLVENGVTSIIILNGHHGNAQILGRVKDTWGVLSYWHFMKHEFDHAGFVETSMMLAISDKVKMKKAKKGLITNGLSEKEIQRINKLSTKRGGFPKVTENGVWGDPTGATRRTERSFLQKLLGT